jgi:hypothetical protein
MHVDDVAVDFPGMTVITHRLAVAGALSVCLQPGVLHRSSGWSPKYFPPQLFVRQRSYEEEDAFSVDFPLTRTAG